MRSTVARVSKLFPHEQVTVAVVYSGWMPCFMGVLLQRRAATNERYGEQRATGRVYAADGSARISAAGNSPSGSDREAVEDTTGKVGIALDHGEFRLGSVGTATAAGHEVRERQDDANAR